MSDNIWNSLRSRQFENTSISVLDYIAQSVLSNNNNDRHSSEQSLEDEINAEVDVPRSPSHWARLKSPGQSANSPLQVPELIDSMDARSPECGDVSIASTPSSSSSPCQSPEIESYYLDPVSPKSREGSATSTQDLMNFISDSFHTNNLNHESFHSRHYASSFDDSDHNHPSDTESDTMASNNTNSKGKQREETISPIEEDQNKYRGSLADEVAAASDRVEATFYGRDLEEQEKCVGCVVNNTVCRVVPFSAPRQHPACFNCRNLSWKCSRDPANAEWYETDSSESESSEAEADPSMPIEPTAAIKRRLIKAAFGGGGDAAAGGGTPAPQQSAETGTQTKSGSRGKSIGREKSERERILANPKKTPSPCDACVARNVECIVKSDDSDLGTVRCTTCLGLKKSCSLVAATSPKKRGASKVQKKRQLNRKR